MTTESSAYRAAGVDIDAKYRAVRDAYPAIRASFTAGVVGDVGLFGGLFDPAKAGAAGQLLVASTDGIGTKVKVGSAAGRLRGLGADLVNHCVGDILVQGARPLFFLDYIAVDRMVPADVTQVIEGLAEACAANGCALLGGETAEMPGVYRPGEMDVAGTIVGCVERQKVLDGTRIHPGDVLVALPSSGLHTNGYSLARRALFELGGLKIDDRPARLQGASVADALLAPHKTYLKALWPALEKGLVHGMAHITGGGLPDNVPRVLPAGCAIEFEKRAVPRPPIFDLIIECGRVAEDEAWRVFNMGVGMLVFVAGKDVDEVRSLAALAGETSFVAGRVVEGAREVRLK
ncbi:MAG: phosphoribosylformylglycinamidine cyclo-ligase [Planctomycetota bacterium]